MGLVVALDDTGSANGELFWDDGESIGKQVFREYMISLHALQLVMLLYTFLMNPSRFPCYSC